MFLSSSCTLTRVVWNKCTFYEIKTLNETLIHRVQELRASAQGDSPQMPKPNSSMRCHLKPDRLGEPDIKKRGEENKIKNYTT